MYATPALPLRRSNRTSFRYVVFSATSGGNGIVLNTLFVARSTPTSFGPAGQDRAELDAAGVQDPQPVGRVHHHALHRHEASPPGGPCRTWLNVGVRVGDGLAVLQLGDGELDRVAPPREVDEDPALVRHGHAGRHRPVERGHDFELAGRLRRRGVWARRRVRPPPGDRSGAVVSLGSLRVARASLRGRPPKCPAPAGRPRGRSSGREHRQQVVLLGAHQQPGLPAPVAELRGVVAVLAELDADRQAHRPGPTPARRTSSAESRDRK